MRPKPDRRARLTSPNEDRDTARRLFRSGWEQLSEHERDVIEASIDHEVNVRADIGIRSVDQRLKEMQEQTSEILHLLREPDARR